MGSLSQQAQTPTRDVPKKFIQRQFFTVRGIGSLMYGLIEGVIISLSESLFESLQA